MVKDATTVPKLLVLRNEQYKTQQYSFYSDRKQGKLTCDKLKPVNV